MNGCGWCLCIKMRSIYPVSPPLCNTFKEWLLNDSFFTTACILDSPPAILPFLIAGEGGGDFSIKSVLTVHKDRRLPLSFILSQSMLHFSRVSTALTHPWMNFSPKKRPVGFHRSLLSYWLYRPDEPFVTDAVCWYKKRGLPVSFCGMVRKVYCILLDKDLLSFDP